MNYDDSLNAVAKATFNYKNKKHINNSSKHFAYHLVTGNLQKPLLVAKHKKTRILFIIKIPQMT